MFLFMVNKVNLYMVQMIIMATKNSQQNDMRPQSTPSSIVLTQHTSKFTTLIKLKEVHRYTKEVRYDTDLRHG